MDNFVYMHISVALGVPVVAFIIGIFIGKSIGFKDAMKEVKEQQRQQMLGVQWRELMEQLQGGKNEQ
jgi:hypothetical protein